MAEAVVQARRDLAAEKLAEHIRQIVEAAPPLSMTQKQQLAALLSAEGPVLHSRAGSPPCSARSC